MAFPSLLCTTHIASKQPVCYGQRHYQRVDPLVQSCHPFVGRLRLLSRARGKVEALASSLLEGTPLLVRLRTAAQEDELVTTDELGRRLSFRYTPTLEWASSLLRSAYEVWGAKQEAEVCAAATKDPAKEELDDWLIDNLLLTQLYAPRILAGFSLGPTGVYLRRVSDKIGWGLFANTLIRAGTYIGEYTGRIEELHSVKENGYACSYVAPPYPLRMRIVINAKPCGNLTRFINHSSQHPNVEWREVLAGALFHAALDVRKDEQLLVDYGKQYWEKRGGEDDL